VDQLLAPEQFMSLTYYPDVATNLLLLMGLVLVYFSPYRHKTFTRAFIAFLFFVLNSRYIHWRFYNTLHGFSYTAESIWIYSFFFFECFAAISLCWHFIVLIKPSDNKPLADKYEAELRSDLSKAKGVDILIPTYNEDPELLIPTIQAASKQEYPLFTVWVLDDGHRDWVKNWCSENEINYVTRTERKGYKAGNLNNGLKASSHPLVCVVDADFTLHPNFLMRTVGFLNTPNAGLIQTPQYFVNPDAIQYNLGGENAWPESQSMFSDVMQPGRDSWSNAFCYGTSFVIKRECLEKIDGFPEDTVAEDIHTTYVIMSEGYHTHFLNEPLSVGIATQDIGQYVTQRSRWCVGTLQCFFVNKGVIRANGLSPVSRFFFFDPIMFHLGTFWSFCMLIAPAVYWWTGVPPFHSDFGHLLVVLAPRMALSVLGFYWLSYRKTLPIVNELSRLICLFKLIPAMFKVLINPFNQKFQITLKSISSEVPTLHWELMWPFLSLIIVTLGGMCYSAYQFFYQSEPLQSNLGLMVSLTIYVLWMLYYTCLLCRQRPINNRTIHENPAVHEGRLHRTLLQLLKVMFKSP
jgi:cellulose synthase (UDP-forming)